MINILIRALEYISQSDLEEHHMHMNSYDQWMK